MDKVYREWFSQIKYKVQQAQLRAVSNFNTILIELYWDLGKEIVARQAEFKWGDNFLQQLSTDLKASFPQIKYYFTITLIRSFGYASIGKLYLTMIRLSNVFSFPSCYIN